MRLHLLVLLAVVPSLLDSASLLTADSISKKLQTLSIDPTKSFHVRDFRLRRGDVSIYLNEGVLAFAEPVGGRTVAAIFTTEGSEGGDGEVILLSSQPAERSSLSSFTGSPNLDEH